MFEINEAYGIEEDKEKIHKTVASLAVQLKQSVNKGCDCLNAMNVYLQGNLVTAEQLQV